MNITANQLSRLLRSVNPVPPDSRNYLTFDARARGELQTILATSRQARPNPSSRAWRASADLAPMRRPVVMAGVTLLIAVCLVVTATIWGQSWFSLSGPSVAYAATPKPLTYEPVAGAVGVSVTLREIAARVEQLSEPRTQGRYTFIELETWNLFTSVQSPRVTSQVVPQRVQTWRALDGSGRIESETLHQGRPAGHETQNFGSGQLASPWSTLSADDNALESQLAAGHPLANGPAERLIAVIDAYKSAPRSPAIRAALLRYLARTPGLQLTGKVTDRAGRPGLAFSLDSAYSGLPTRYTLIIDPDRGQLLGSEEMLTETAGKLNVPIPSVIAYAMFRQAGYVDELP